jgi:hypothetical protein
VFFARDGRACLSGFRAKPAHLGQAKVENLGVPSIGDEDVGRFNIAVNDAFGMGRIESVGDVDAKIKETFCFQRTPENELLQRLAFQVLHHDKGPPFVIADFVNGANVGMVESRRRPGFASKTLQRLIILGDVVGQKFQGDHAAKLSILSLVHDTHPTHSKFSQNSIMRDGFA